MPASMPIWQTKTQPALTAAPAAITINSPVLCWVYAITRSGGKNKVLPQERPKPKD